MNQKLEIARQLRISNKNFSKNIEHKKIFRKCYQAYVIECILKRKDSFQITFKGKYTCNFSKRMEDWINYIFDSIYYFFLVHVTPNNDRTFHNYNLIHYGVSAPVHIRVTNAPNEIILEEFLRENGFKIIEEHLSSVSTVYDIARV